MDLIKSLIAPLVCLAKGESVSDCSRFMLFATVVCVRLGELISKCTASELLVSGVILIDLTFLPKFLPLCFPRRYLFTDFQFYQHSQKLIQEKNNLDKGKANKTSCVKRNWNLLYVI